MAEKAEAILTLATRPESARRLLRELRANRIPTPRTIIVDKSRVQALEQELPFPMVLKIPDGSFSRGVIKAHNRQELVDGAQKLLKESDVILAQQFIYTDFDWRVGILRGEPLFACHYLMADGHWQIVRHESAGRLERVRFGQARTAGGFAAGVDIERHAAFHA